MIWHIVSSANARQCSAVCLFSSGEKCAQSNSTLRGPMSALEQLYDKNRLITHALESQMKNSYTNTSKTWKIHIHNKRSVRLLQVSWVHWILATLAINEVAIHTSRETEEREKITTTTTETRKSALDSILSAVMCSVVHGMWFSWAWDSGRNRLKRGKARFIFLNTKSSSSTWQFNRFV